MKRFFWKIWLRLNWLTKDNTEDYTAEVSTVGNTKRNSDIAQKIVEGRTELRKDTIEHVLNMRDEIVRGFVQEGSSVQDGVVRIAPRVSGVWLNKKAPFNPEVNKITCDVTLTAEMRQALLAVGVEVLDVKDSGAGIGKLIDAATNLTDGTLTPGDYLIIDGDKLKVAPEDEAGLGVFFVADNGSEFAADRLMENNPKRVVAHVPALAAGNYTVQIRTKYTGGATLLKEVRTIASSKLLTVVTAGA